MRRKPIGRSRGGLSTKIHALVDALGRPLALLLTPGQAHDLVGADALLPPSLSPGSSRPNRLNPPAFDRDRDKARHLIENFFCRLKQFRAFATRYDKTAKNFLAAVYLAGATIWLN